MLYAGFVDDSLPGQAVRDGIVVVAAECVESCAEALRQRKKVNTTEYGKLLKPDLMDRPVDSLLASVMSFIFSNRIPLNVRLLPRDDKMGLQI